MYEPSVNTRGVYYIAGEHTCANTAQRCQLKRGLGVEPNIYIYICMCVCAYIYMYSRIQIDVDKQRDARSGGLTPPITPKPRVHTDATNRIPVQSGQADVNRKGVRG